jgi:hypothetical protein
MWCGYQKVGNYCYLTVFVDSSLMQWFYFRNDVTLGLWMLSFRSLLTFCEGTHWPLVIDVHVIRDIVGNNNNSVANCIFYLTNKSNQPEDGS